MPYSQNHFILLANMFNMDLMNNMTRKVVKYYFSPGDSAAYNEKFSKVSLGHWCVHVCWCFGLGFLTNKAPGTWLLISQQQHFDLKMQWMPSAADADLGGIFSSIFLEFWHEQQQSFDCRCNCKWDVFQGKTHLFSQRYWGTSTELRFSLALIWIKLMNCK